MAALVRCPGPRDKGGVEQVMQLARRGVAAAVDFALPPTCPGCSMLVETPHAFCPDCWAGARFLHGGCEACGIPLEATEATHCAACLAKPPRIARTRAAIAYDGVARQLALKLKYGRKVGLARTMARSMATHRGDWPADGALLVPVPLHWTRLWGRGFNQAQLLAKELGRGWGLPVDPFVLRRSRRTRALKGMDPAARRAAVAGAFAVTDPARIAERTVVLVDDVLTSGATADACARAVLKAGAARVELICWARVIR
ncbi:ComF family protein [Sphingomonas sp. ASV193]|uniref:ComF family protein n=1 Tax=Sphingomonas sp. ASV193 TaxID=3144405 RepID=UPI0032E8DAA4